MKIIDAKVFVTCPGRNFVTLKILTDEGVYGLGDATLNGRELAVASYLSDHLIPCLVGRDPFQTEDVWQYLYRGAYWRRGPVTMTAIAAVDMALWDIKGKALKTPVYNLLGGKAEPAYWSTDTRMGATLRRPPRKWRSIRRWVIWRCARSPVFRAWNPLTELQATSFTTSRRKKVCLQKIYGPRKNISCMFLSCSKLCA